MSVSDHHYLIIGGTPKAGTTSLYKWLSDHPDVCASSMKETRFFLDSDYPLPSPAKYNGKNLEQYAVFFKQCEDNKNKLRLDATPDYLYSETALKIAVLLPHSKIVFILRDPIERMISWFKYAKQEGMISQEMNFEQYVMLQVGKPIDANLPIFLRALEQCKFDKYLKEFYKVFPSRCLIIDFNDLKSNPRKVMTELCAFSNLEDKFYDSYLFKAENVSQTVNNTSIIRFYSLLRQTLIHTLHQYPAIFELMKKPNQLLKKILFRHSKQAEELTVSLNIEEIIKHEVKQYALEENIRAYPNKIT